MENLKKLYVPQNFFAKINGEVYSVHDVVKKNLTGDFLCPCCGKKLKVCALDSEYKQTYFAHLANESCVKKDRHDAIDVRNPIHKRQVELTMTQVKDLKQRIESLEYIYAFIKRNRNGITKASKKELLSAITLLDYEDQVFIAGYSKHVSCLKPIAEEITNLVNKNAIALLNQQFPGCAITNSKANKIAYSYYSQGRRGRYGSWHTVYSDVLRTVPHQVHVEYKDLSFDTKPVRKDNGHLYLTEGDFERITNEIAELIKYKDDTDELYEIMTPICSNLVEQINSCKNRLWEASMSINWGAICIEVYNKWSRRNAYIRVKNVKNENTLREAVAREMACTLSAGARRIVFAA